MRGGLISVSSGSECMYVNRTCLPKKSFNIYLLRAFSVQTTLLGAEDTKSEHDIVFTLKEPLTGET